MTRLLKSWWPKHLRGRLTALVLVTLVPMLVAQAVVFGYWYQTQKSSELQNNLDMAGAFGTYCQSYLNDLAHTEQTLGQALLRVDPGPALELLTSRANDYPGIYSFSWADPEGTIVNSSRSNAKGVSVADRQYFREILQGKDWTVSDLLVTRVGGNHRLIQACGIRSEDNVLLGVVLGEVIPERLGSILASPRSGEESCLFLTGRAG